MANENFKRLEAIASTQGLDEDDFTILIGKVIVLRKWPVGTGVQSMVFYSGRNITTTTRKRF